MRIVIGADHNGLASKDTVRQWLEAAGHSVVDVGPHQHDPDDDYPDFARMLGEILQRGEADRGHPALRQRCGRKHCGEQDARHSRGSLSRRVFGTSSRRA